MQSSLDLVFSCRWSSIRLYPTARTEKEQDGKRRREKGGKEKGGGEGVGRLWSTNTIRLLAWSYSDSSHIHIPLDYIFCHR